jgi:hypothetical protein
MSLGSFRGSLGRRCGDVAIAAAAQEMDQSIAVAHGWSDLDSGHGFHETKQGIRFTISESAGRSIGSSCMIGISASLLQADLTPNQSLRRSYRTGHPE